MKHLFRLFHDVNCPCRAPGGPNEGSLTSPRAPQGAQVVIGAFEVVWIEIPEAANQ